MLPTSGNNEESETPRPAGNRLNRPDEGQPAVTAGVDKAATQRFLSALVFLGGALVFYGGGPNMPS